MMPIFRCDFRVESDFKFQDGIGQPASLEGVEAVSSFENGPLDKQGAVSCLVAHVVGNAISADKAPGILRDRLANHLDLLAFVTQSRFKISNELRLIDWEPHQKSRKMFVLNSQDARYPPEPQPLEILIKSATAFDREGLQDFVRKALKYYRYGLLEDQPEDQFMRFWLSLEIIAVNTMEETTTLMSCVSCGTSLTCKCGHIPTRRVMATEAILQMCDNIHGGEHREMSRKLLKARNSLMHGGSVETIESECKLSMIELTGHLGVVTWHAILSASPQSNVDDFVIVDRGTDITPLRLNLRTHIEFSHEDEKPHPSEERIPNPTIELSTHFKPEESSAL